jgi:hypothetical protein
MANSVPEEPLEWSAVGHLVFGKKLGLNPLGLLRRTGGNDDAIDVDSQDQHVLPTSSSVEAGVGDTSHETEGQEESVELLVPQARALA